MSLQSTSGFPRWKFDQEYYLHVYSGKVVRFPPQSQLLSGLFFDINLTRSELIRYSRAPVLLLNAMVHKWPKNKCRHRCPVHKTAKMLILQYFRQCRITTVLPYSTMDRDLTDIYLMENLWDYNLIKFIFWFTCNIFSTQCSLINFSEKLKHHSGVYILFTSLILWHSYCIL